MASLRDISFTPEETNAAMRASAGEIMETIARTREVIRKSRDVIAKPDRLLSQPTNQGESRASISLAGR